MGAIVEEDNLELPEQLRYLYDLFMDLRFNKIPVDDGFSLMPCDSLTYSDIYHNSLLTGLELYKWEIEAILSMNSIFDKYAS